jgi:methionine synthase II (cobalamin-independent)
MIQQSAMRADFVGSFLRPETVKKAAEYIPLDRLCLSPQCGFASCEIGNKLTEEEQWAKLRLVREVAKEVWGD